MIRFSVITIFPELIRSYTEESIIKRAQKAGAVQIAIYDLRSWTTDKHHTVDDKIFGGAAGMLLKIEPLFVAINELKQKAVSDGFVPKVITTKASGTFFTQRVAESYAKKREEDTDYIILCGRYEGFDARIEAFIDEEFSIGPYILTGGELPALIIMDSVIRLLPGVLGNPESAVEETDFLVEGSHITVIGEHPQYAPPATFIGNDYAGVEHTLEVPEILRSGHHKKLTDFNKSQRKEKQVTLGE